MSRLRYFRVPCAFACWLFILVGRLQATTLVYVQGGADIMASPDYECLAVNWESRSAAGGSILFESGLLSYHGYDYSATAQGGVWARHGSLGVYGYADGVNFYSPGSFIQASAGGWAGFTDTFTVLPPVDHPELMGMPCTFAPEVTAKGYWDAPGCMFSVLIRSDPDPYFSNYNYREEWLIMSAGGPWRGSLVERHAFRRPGCSFGNPFKFTLEMYGGVGSRELPGGVNFWETADVTAIQVYDSAGSEIRGFDVTAESGHVYPIPAPSSLSLLAVGGALAIALRWCRWREKN